MPARAFSRNKFSRQLALSPTRLCIRDPLQIWFRLTRHRRYSLIFATATEWTATSLNRAQVQSLTCLGILDCIRGSWIISGMNMRDINPPSWTRTGGKIWHAEHVGRCERCHARTWIHFHCQEGRKVPCCGPVECVFYQQALKERQHRVHTAYDANMCTHIEHVA